MAIQIWQSYSFCCNKRKRLSRFQSRSRSTHSFWATTLRVKTASTSGDPTQRGLFRFAIYFKAKTDKFLLQVWPYQAQLSVVKTLKLHKRDNMNCSISDHGAEVPRMTIEALINQSRPTLLNLHLLESSQLSLQAASLTIASSAGHRLTMCLSEDKSTETACAWNKNLTSARTQTLNTKPRDVPLEMT